MKTSYSSKNFSDELIDEILNSLASIEYGSLEIYVQKGQVSQITTRKIKKTNGLTKRYSKK